MKLRFASGFLVVAALSSAACGGLVVFEREDGSGGSGGSQGPGGPGGGGVTSGEGASTSTLSNAGGGSNTTGMNPCQALLLTLETAIDHARACSPLDPSIQCDGSATLLDTCGCPSFIANEHNLTEIDQARAAYEAWVSAGCGPYPCESCTPAVGSGFCETFGDGSKGRCQTLPPPPG